MLRNKSLKQTCTKKDKVSNHDWLRSRVMWLYSALDQCLDNFPTKSNNRRPRKIDTNYIISLLSCRIHINTLVKHLGISAQSSQFTHSTVKSYYYPCTSEKFYLNWCKRLFINSLTIIDCWMKSTDKNSLTNNFIKSRLQILSAFLSRLEIFCKR